MKAAIDIDFKNLRGFDVDTLKEGQSSYFTVKKGEDVEKGLVENGYTEAEIGVAKARLLRGGADRIILCNKKEYDKLEEVNAEKAKEEKRLEELKKLNRKEQVKMLKKLGAENVPHYEIDRAKLIYKLESK